MGPRRRFPEGGRGRGETHPEDNNQPDLHLTVGKIATTEDPERLQLNSDRRLSFELIIKYRLELIVLTLIINAEVNLPRQRILTKHLDSNIKRLTSMSPFFNFCFCFVDRLSSDREIARIVSSGICVMNSANT